jgi:multiple antibiotic resistance protein
MTGSTAATALVTLLVTIGPVEIASVFGMLTASADERTRRRLATRACVLGGSLLLVFALGGNQLLQALHVGVPAFRAAGGVLLLSLSRDMVFAPNAGLAPLTYGEEREAAGHTDIVVFPLAIPLIAGPGSITAIVLLTGRAQTWLELAVVILALLVVMAVTLGALLYAGRLTRLLGITGVNVAARLSGILLAALAMQFVFDALLEIGLLR